MNRDLWQGKDINIWDINLLRVRGGSQTFSTQADDSTDPERFSLQSTADIFSEWENNEGDRPERHFRDDSHSNKSSKERWTLLNQRHVCELFPGRRRVVDERLARRGRLWENYTHLGTTAALRVHPIMSAAGVPTTLLVAADSGRHTHYCLPNSDTLHTHFLF